LAVLKGTYARLIYTGSWTPPKITAADPASIGHVLDLAVTRGSLRDLGPGSLAVSSKTAAARHWTLGSRVLITYPEGTTATLRVAAIFGHPDITGDYLLDQAGWDPHAGQNLDSAVFIRVAAGNLASTVRAAVGGGLAAAAVVAFILAHAVLLVACACVLTAVMGAVVDQSRGLPARASCASSSARVPR
jgi:hypothetical protein